MSCKVCYRDYNDRPNDMCDNHLHWQGYVSELERWKLAPFRGVKPCNSCGKETDKTSGVCGECAKNWVEKNR